MKTFITFLFTIITILLASFLSSLPWWSFLVPLFLLGVFLPLVKWKVNAFLTAFFGGLFTWIGATLYYEMTYEGQLIEAIGEVMQLNPILLYGLVGLIGGTLSGLAVYSGFLLRKGREALRLDIHTINE